MKHMLPTKSYIIFFFLLSQSLENANLASQPDLERLDVSRNNIANIAPGTFLGLSHLRELDLSVNALRTVSSHTMQLIPQELQQFSEDKPLKRTTTAPGRRQKMVFHVEKSQYINRCIKQSKEATF